MFWIRLSITSSVVLLSALAVAQSDDEIDLSPYYGFRGLEVYKLERRSSGLNAADLDADGRTDLLLIDNSHSRLDLLRQREQRASPESAPRGDVNFVPNSGRFEHIKIAVDREVVSLVTGDFNGDGRTDIAYIGKPDRLIVRFGAEENIEDWTKQVEQRLPDLVETGVILAVGDLNGDSRDDLAVLGKEKTYVILQTDDGKLAPATALMNTSDGLALVQAADLDGDGRADLSYTANSGGEQILCARLQTAQGTLGPEVRFPLSRPRSVTLADVDRRPGSEILTIDATTGRLTISSTLR